MHSKKTDFLIIGAGIIGINLALSLRAKYKDSSITIIEKEKKPALHASGRNSGVLHSGFYYTPDSIKAEFCRDGNKYLTEYCLQRKLPINQCGKIVVAKNEDDLEGLDILLERGRKNDVELIEIDQKQTKEIDPNVSTFKRAIFSPNTSTVDPKLVVNSLIDELKEKSIVLITDNAYVKSEGNLIYTSRGRIEAGFVINSAGLYADKIALDFGFSDNYRILPFKGVYLYTNHEKFNLKTCVYPVPDLRNPFLGVHLTVDVNGRTKIGPTAMPAFWREQYSGFKNFVFSESLEIIFREISLFFNNHFNFRSLAVDELKKQSKRRMIKDIKSMAPSLGLEKLSHWGSPGIRAQLVNILEKKLEMDFIFEGDRKSFHILNAVSPAFTCSKPFADHVVTQIEHNLS